MDEPEITEVGLQRPDGSFSSRAAGPAIRHRYPDRQWAEDMERNGVPVWERVIVVKVEWRLRQPQDQASQPADEHPAVQVMPERRQITA